jgi:hypothetical protein
MGACPSVVDDSAYAGISGVMRMNCIDSALTMALIDTHEWASLGRPVLIRRRLLADLRNFETLYKPIVNEWLLYDNSAASPRFLAEGVNQ